MLQRKTMSWRRVAKSAQALAAHSFLFSFTLLLVLKLDHVVSYSWWMVFAPLWLFHAVVARGRFSLPAPSIPHDRNWAPCHAVVATPLLIAFELLLCVYLESIYVQGFAALNLKIVFLPLLAFEVIILIDNFRMCRALMPGDEEGMNDDAIWEMLPHFWVAISMVFLVAGTTFTLLKLCGDVGALGWWDLFINFGYSLFPDCQFFVVISISVLLVNFIFSYSIAECFAFLVCTKWSNPMIHRHTHNREASSSSTTIRYLDWNSGLVVSSEEDQYQDRICSLQDIGGHIMKIPLIGFQVLLFMHLEGTPPGARHIPLPVLFSPLFLLQGAGVLFAILRLVERIVLLLRTGAGTTRYLTISSRARDCFGFLHRGSRLLGWWSIDEGSREEHSRLYQHGTAGYNTFCRYPPDIVKKMPKKDLAEENEVVLRFFGGYLMSSGGPNHRRVCSYSGDRADSCMIPTHSGASFPPSLCLPNCGGGAQSGLETASCSSLDPSIDCAYTFSSWGWSGKGVMQDMLRGRYKCGPDPVQASQPLQVLTLLIQLNLLPKKGQVGQEPQACIVHDFIITIKAFNESCCSAICDL
ncbi:Transmembrane Fragile-X-F-associated protein [Macleaya cordata]|uniref:Transmembrane Fragile-X-F-associated protein n=1 Tax=Macleaya cordata TaxID=56857 RepID=A0A200Q3K1_MACCD|nr:Transmembrane Fragile-X-F-associated protein [Macleaya cordata]